MLDRNHATKRLWLGRIIFANLIYTLAVIIWGALVRATGSGAGCGHHWPLCHGEVIVADAHVTTFIEWTHRAMSGGLIFTCLACTALSFLWLPGGHGGRRASLFVTGFVMIEAAIGAALVLFGLVGDNPSTLRAYVMGGHLINTLFLLSAQYTHLWCLKPRRPPLRVRALITNPVLMMALVMVLATASTGAMVALGDTLFPASSLGEGIAATHDPNSHILVRLRWVHPMIAVLSSLCVAVLGASLLNRPNTQLTSTLKSWTLAMLVGVLVQLLAGVINWLLLVPITTQLIHLALACWLWIALWATALESMPQGGASGMSQ